MDRRISYKIIIDTETCPIDKDFNGGVNPHNMFTYDYGWAIVDKRGNVYKTRSFVNADIFLGEKDLMQSAYYANKIPMYWEKIKKGEMILTSLYNIRKAFLEDCEEYGIKQVFAHNMYFDNNTLNETQRWVTKSLVRYFFPYNIEICDTLKMARQVIAKMPTYIKFCKDNNFITKNNQVQLKAEVIYKFLTKDLTFKESHTSLEDVLIEKEILAYCYRQHKKMDVHLYNQ